MINLGRPDLLYAMLWSTVVLLTYLFPTNLTSPISKEIFFLVLVSIITFIFSYTFWWLVFRTRPRILKCFTNDFEILILRNFVLVIFKIWFSLLIINIVFSGGIPLFWLISGDTRTYADFGVPSFSGFSNMFRLFMSTAAVLLFIKTRLKRYLWLLLIMFVSCILEMSRGGVIVAMLYSIAVFTMLYRFTPFYVIKCSFLLVALLSLFILGFGFLGELRGSGILVKNMVPESSVFNLLPSGFFWVFTYITSPFNNLNFAAHLGIEQTMTGEYTFSSLLPSVIRVLIFTGTESKYPIALASEAFNATSYFAPMIADFGYVFAAMIVAILQFITCYVYFRALRGSYYFFILYPALFMCLMMSVFYSYYFSLIVVMYPMISLIYVTYRKYFILRIGNNLQQ